MKHTRMHRISEHPEKTFSGWFLVFLVLALAAIVLYIFWNLSHPHAVHLSTCLLSGQIRI